MGDENKNNFRLKRSKDILDDEGRLKRVIKREKQIKLYQPPGFEKYSEGDDQNNGIARSAQAGSNLCCCDSVCSCHSVDTDSCGCHEVCTCHDVCTCDSECYCDSHTCSCVSHSGCYTVTYYYTYQTYYTYTYRYY